MDYQELIRTRYSVRKFQPRQVEEEKVTAILEAGRLAPTAKNQQPQHIYVLRSEEAIAKIESITKMTFHAKTVLLICGNADQAVITPFNNRNSMETDIAIVTTCMMLKAVDLDLGATWVCWFDTDKTKELFRLPEGEEPYYLLPIGYPAENAQPGPMHGERKDLAETVTYL